MTTRGQAKVLDFGLAKLTVAASLVSARGRPQGAPLQGGEDIAATARATASIEPDQLTSPGVVMGTVAYMSPEQARGEELDARTDLFSFGAVLYEMATGRQAFSGTTTAVIFNAILSGAPTSPVQLNPELPPKLEEIINKALEKDRDLRCQSAAELRAELKRLKRDTNSGRAPAAAPAADGHGAAAVSARRYSPIWRWGLAIGVLTVASALAVSYFQRSSGKPHPIDSLAILPLANAGGDPSTEYLSDGISEGVINSLTQVPNLRVMARTTVFRYKGKDADPQKVGSDLHVRAAMTGRLLQRGDTLIVQAELVDVDTGSQLWGAEYHRKLADVLAIQEDISREISEKLRLRLTGEQERGLTKSHTENAEAYQLYLKGRYEWNKRTPESLKKGLDYFNAAIEKDPNYALAYAGRSQIYAAAPVYGLFPPSEANPIAESAAQMAVTLDDTLAEGHLALAGAKVDLYDWPGAKKEFERALELNPGLAEVHYLYGFEYLDPNGRFEEEFAELRRALDLDPLSLIVNANLAEHLWVAGRNDEALEQARKTVELDSQFANGHLVLGTVFTRMGRFPEAIAELQKADSLAPGNTQPLARIGYTYSLWGKRAEALKVLEKLKEMSRTTYVAGYDMALLYSSMGQKDEAFTWLEKDLKEHSWRMIFLKVDPRFESLHSGPRFQDLLRRMNFPP